MHPNSLGALILCPLDSPWYLCRRSTGALDCCSILMLSVLDVTSPWPGRTLTPPSSSCVCTANLQECVSGAQEADEGGASLLTKIYLVDIDASKLKGLKQQRVTTEWCRPQG